MTAGGLTILILGGYGTFGARLAGLLADEPRLSLLIAGRSLPKAEALCRTLSGGAAAKALAFDRDGDVAAQLRTVRPDILVDASGPFQAYGAEPYRVVQACIAQGVDYLDLADGSAFVSGVTAHDQDARAAGVFVLSGVSTFPVLTAAAVRHLAEGLERVDTITGGIAPSPHARVGLNVIRAISDYAGKPVALVRDGRPGQGRAFVDARRFTVRPPGGLPLRPTLFSLVDVPDHQLLPELWPQARSVWMGAGPRPELVHRALRGLARLVRLGLIGSLGPLAPLLHAAASRLRWGEHRGGMFVQVTGADAGGRNIVRGWHLLAEGDDGPLIPSMAAEALIRHALEGRRPGAGARPATRELELGDYEPLFARRSIQTGVREAPPGSAPLYRRVLGEAFEQLPAPVRALHLLDGDHAAAGEAEVERGRNPLAAAAAALFGFPPAGRAVPVRVTFSVAGGVETWMRSFGGRRFSSVQSEGAGVWEGLLVERFGAVRVGLALVIDGERMRLVVRRWSFLGIPLPLALAPGGEAFETAQDGRFRFHVEIGHPLSGLIVRYMGWLEPETPDRPPG